MTRIVEAARYSLILIVLLLFLNLLTLELEQGPWYATIYSVNAAIAIIIMSNEWFKKAKDAEIKANSKFSISGPYRYILTIAAISICLYIFRVKISFKLSDWYLLPIFLAIVVVISLISGWLKNRKYDFLKDGFLLGTLWFFVPPINFMGPIICASSGLLLNQKFTKQAIAKQSKAIKSIKRAFVFGLAIWVFHLMALALAMWIDVRNPSRSMYDVVNYTTPVSLAAATVFFTCLYFRNIDKDFIKEGYLLGLVWFVMNVGLDLFVLFRIAPHFFIITYYLDWTLIKPDEGTLASVSYILGSGISYFLIPLLTINAGYLLSSKENRLAKGLIYSLVFRIARWLSFFIIGFILIKLGVPDDAIGSNIPGIGLFVSVTIISSIIITIIWLKDSEKTSTKEIYLFSAILLGTALLTDFRDTTLMYAELLLPITSVCTGWWIRYCENRKTGIFKTKTT